MRHRESDLQEACLKWFSFQFPKLRKLLLHVPNGGLRNKIEAANFKRQGVVSGVADLLLLIPSNGYGCLCLEMKAEKGKQSENQIQWQSEVEKAGNKYAVCRSFDEFKTEIENYLNKNL